MGAQTGTPAIRTATNETKKEFLRTRSLLHGLGGGRLYAQARGEHNFD